MSDRRLTALDELLAPLVAKLVTEELERRLDSRWVTLEEAAERYRMTADALRKRAQRGRVPGAAKDGSRWLVDVAAYDRALMHGTLDDDFDEKGSRRGNGRAPAQEV